MSYHELSFPDKVQYLSQDILEARIDNGIHVVAPSILRDLPSELPLINDALQSVDQEKLRSALQKSGQQSALASMAIAMTEHLGLPKKAVVVESPLRKRYDRVSIQTNAPDYSFFDLTVTSYSGVIALNGIRTVFTRDKPFIQVMEDNVITPAGKLAPTYAYTPHSDTLYRGVLQQSIYRDWEKVDPSDDNSREQFLTTLVKAHEAVHR
jgi:hypothetical protein